MAFTQSNTSRLWVAYTVGGFQHEILFRCPVGGAVSGLGTTAAAICEVLAEVMHNDDNFVSARYSDLGSGFSAPIPWTVIPGNGGTSLVAGDSESRYIDVIGRDLTFGARVRWSFFTRCGVIGIPPTNRFQPGDNVDIDAIVNIFQTAVTNPTASTRVCAISKGQPVVYPYVNSGYNAYWQRAQRA